MWSYRESPLVDGDKVICTPGAPDAMLVALNKTSGEVIWKTIAPVPAEPAAPPANAGQPSDGERGGRGRRGGNRGGAAYSSIKPSNKTEFGNMCK